MTKKLISHLHFVMSVRPATCVIAFSAFGASSHITPLHAPVMALWRYGVMSGRKTRETTTKSGIIFLCVSVVSVVSFVPKKSHAQAPRKPHIANAQSLIVIPDHPPQ